MLDMYVLIRSREFYKYDYEYKSELFKLPISYEELIEVFGNECIDRGNYYVWFEGEFSNIKLCLYNDFEYANDYYYSYKSFCEEYPDFPEISFDGYFHLENGKLNLEDILVRRNGIISFENFTSSEDVKGLEEFSSNFYYVVGKNRVLRLHK